MERSSTGIKERFFFVRKNLPTGYLIQNGRLLKKIKGETEKIANFIPVVVRTVEIYDVFNENITIKVEVGAIICAGQSEKMELTATKCFGVADLDCIDFQSEIDCRCYAENVKVASKFLGSVLRKQLSAISPEVILIASKLGHFKFKGRHGFVAGDKVFGEGLPEIQIADELKKYSLISKAGNVPYNSEAVEKYVRDLLHLNERVMPVLLMANILGIMHEAFDEAGTPIKFSLYVLGEQSTGKTTAVTYACSMYNRADDVEKNLHNLTATDARLNQILDLERHMPILIDDLRLSDSAAIMRQQEVKLDNLIRVAANNVGRESMRYEYAVGGFVIFVGEYALQNPSTNNRIVLLEMKKDDLDKKQLKLVTHAPEHLSWFFANFIEWFVKNYDSIIAWIMQEKRYFVQNRESKEQYQERLQSHGNTLLIAYKIFLQFCDFQGWDMEFDLEAYRRCLDNVLYNQIETLQLDCEEKVSYIVELYRSLAIELEDDRVFRRPKKDLWRQRLYVDEENDLVYIPSSTLGDMLENLSKPTSVYQAISEFDCAGLLRKDRNKNHSRTKKIEGKRCYVISWSLWKEYVEDIVFTQTFDE